MAVKEENLAGDWARYPMAGIAPSREAAFDEILRVGPYAREVLGATENDHVVFEVKLIQTGGPSKEQIIQSLFQVIETGEKPTISDALPLRRSWLWRWSISEKEIKTETPQKEPPQYTDW